MKIQDLFEWNTREDMVTIETMTRLSEILRENCKDIYQHFYSRSNDEKFRHATDSTITNIYSVIKNREGRTPTDTPPYFHRVMDSALEERFGVKFRSNSIFTYYMPYSSSYYVLFPYDGYKMITSDQVHDMFILVRDVLSDGPEVQSQLKAFLLKHATLESGEDILEKHKGRIKFMSSHLFPTLGNHTWIKQEDFPNTQVFIEEFNKSIKRIMGDDVTVDARKEDYQKLLKNIIEIVNHALRQSVKSYNIVNGPEDVNHESSKRHEVMIHSERFVLVDMDSILTYLVNTDRDNDYSENDVIKMLYSGDLTASE